MRDNQRPCPKCGEPMHRQSRMCRACYMLKQSTPEARAALSEKRTGQPSYERTPEIRARMSRAQKGKPKLALRGRKRPEHSLRMKKWWTPERREAARQRGLLQAENYDWLVKIAESLSGENNPNYQGKGQESPYGPGWGRGYRAKIRARAEGICESCGRHVDYVPDLHHIDFGKSDHSPENLAVLCRSCHKTLHFANSAKT